MKIINTIIEDVVCMPLQIIKTGNGDILKLLGPHSPLLPDYRKEFGEIYFSEVLPQPALPKAWKLHKKQTQLLAVPAGLIKIALFDAREESVSANTILELKLGRPNHYNLLKIPPNIWYGFQAIDSPALICNCADIPHDPSEMERLDYNTEIIDYKW